MATKMDFTDLTKQFQEMWTRFGAMAPDMTKAMKMPEAGTEFWTAVMATNQNNMQALAEMNESVANSMKSIGERQRSLFETMMAEIERAGKDIGGNGEDVSKAASEAYEKMLGGMREIAEIAEKANRDALAEIEKRSAAFQDELKSIMKKAKA